MISVTNTEGDDYDLGVDFIEYKEGEIYVSDVNRGPFYDTGRFVNGLWFIVHCNEIFSILTRYAFAHSIVGDRRLPNLFVSKLTKPCIAETKSLPSTGRKLQSICLPLTTFTISYTLNPKSHSSS